MSPFISMLSSQVHALHFDPKSILLLSTFAFLCEAFVSIAPSVALLRHFFSLRLTANAQCSGCMSLCAMSATASEDIDIDIHPEAKGFRRQCVYVDMAQFSPLLQTPSSPAEASSGWRHERLVDPRLSRVMAKMADLRVTGVTVTMMVRDFIHRRMALLQRHSCPMWAFTGPKDAMRLQMACLPPDVLSGILLILNGREASVLPQKGLPLYNYTSKGDFFERMSRFDQ